VRIAITGGTGFIGQPLVAHLATLGHRAIVLSRSPERAARVSFPAGTEIAHADVLPSCDAVIHLAAESVAGLWTPAKRRRILASRVESTRRIVAELRERQHRPQTLLVASAVGYYGDRPGELLTEDAAPDPQCGFRSEVCRAWEAAAAEAEALGIRVVRLRLGNVMSTHGGFLGAMLPLWRRGACFLLGNPEAAISWISREDAVRLIAFALESEQLRGPVNVVSPHAITQRTLVTSVARRLGRSVIGQVPGSLLRAGLGEFATALLDDQRVVPAAAESAGFRYQHPAWRSCLDHLFDEQP
jgi:uncharacterized protein (TIGR01777 family)